MRGRCLCLYRSSLPRLAVAVLTAVTFNCGKPPAEPVAAPAPAPVPPWPNTFPPGFPAAAISGNIPMTVTLPAKFSTPLEIRPYFDYFSWQSLIALNWPAAPNQRGVPNQPGSPSVFLAAASGTPVVWGTYKDTFDLFGQGENRPTPWESMTSPVNACGTAAPGQKTLTFSTMSDSQLMQNKQAFSLPLIDQQGNYVYYDVRYNEAQYNFVRGQDATPTSWLYRLVNLGPVEKQKFGVQMPMTTAKALGSIMVKAAWRVQTPNDDVSRFLASPALIYDAQKKACVPATVLLVGLHIAHKVDPFTEWVWSTFEQVDNVPADSDITPPPPPGPRGFSFNNGTGTPKTNGGYNYRPSTDVTAPQKPVQVTRLNPIPNTPAGQSTREVNAYYQQLLKGSVWQYYQLAVTQWPFNPGIGDGNPFQLMQNGGVYPQNAGSAFPVNGAVNTTMETYFQSMNDAAGAGGNSCMSCHYRAGQSDFSWGLNRRAY
ncbi:MAG: hypothetical protein JNM66_11820 [Bryobacterales bacterium]|nr:hypothetical protein [Bryobacterales bacterium]